MFLLGGHMGPPLRRIMRMGKNCPTHFCHLNAHFWKENGKFRENSEETVDTPCWYPILGADLCVRP